MSLPEVVVALVAALGLLLACGVPIAVLVTVRRIDARLERLEQRLNGAR